MGGAVIEMQPDLTSLKGLFMFQRGLEHRTDIFVKHGKQLLDIATNWFLMMNLKELVSILLVIMEWQAFTFPASRLFCVCIEHYGFCNVAIEDLGF